MDYRRTSAPLGQADKLAVVSVADAMLQMRVVDDNEQPFIAGLIEDAYDWFAAERGWLGHCCLLAETFQAYYAADECWRRERGFDHSRPRHRTPMRLELPMRPVTSTSSIVAVEVLQDDGTYAALDPSLYNVVLDADELVAAIVQASLYQPWPRFAPNTPGAFRVTFTAGFGAAAEVPGPICRAIKLLAATMYNQRESTADTVAQEVIYGLRALAGRWRIEPDHS